MLKPIPYRPLGLVINLMEEVGLVYSYCYEDLVFVESSVVLFRMGDKPEEVYCYFSEDCPGHYAENLEIQLSLKAKSEGLHFIASGKYRLKESSENQVTVEFL